MATIPKGWKELELDTEESNLCAYEADDGTIFVGITPENGGRTKGGEGKNVNCGGTHGYRSLTGSALKGAKVNLHLIRKPQKDE